MQLLDQANRLNRIPRMPTPRLGLCRRLYLRACLLKAQLKRSEIVGALRELEHDMALDLAAAEAHKVAFTKSPVLMSRMAEDHLVRAGLLRSLDSIDCEIRALEWELGL